MPGRGWLVVVVAILGAGAAPAAQRFEGGFVPPTKPVARCENGIVGLLSGNAACLDGCTLRAVRRALRSGVPFDDEACEERCGGALVRAAVARFAAGGCPACIEALPPALIAMLNEQASNAGAGLVACAGTVPLGGDDSGFLPPDRPTARCELAVGRAASRLDRGVLACHAHAARAAFTGRRFDFERCGGAVERRYRAAVARLEGCPPCLDAAGLAMRIVSGIATGIPLVYCASAGGAFLDAPGLGRNADDGIARRRAKGSWG